MRRLLTRFAGFASVVALGVLLAGCSASQGVQPSQTTCNQFLQDLKSGQQGAAYSLLSTKCKSALTLQRLQNTWVFVEKNRGKVQSWSQQGAQIYAGTGGSRVTLGYVLQAAKGQVGVRFICEEENNKWLIRDINISV